MKQAIVTLRSASPYSQSKFHETAKLPKELSAAYEERTWRERLHYNEDGNIFIPPMAFANTIKQAAKYLNIQVPGKGKATFTKNFEAGIMVVDPLILPNKKDDVLMERVLVPSDGKRGGNGPKVVKNFGVIPSWSGDVIFHIFDDMITEDIFLEVLKTAGSLIGIGRFRPRNCGYYGRFNVEDMQWIIT